MFHITVLNSRSHLIFKTGKFQQALSSINKCKRNIHKPITYNNQNHNIYCIYISVSILTMQWNYLQLSIILKLIYVISIFVVTGEYNIINFKLRIRT